MSGGLLDAEALAAYQRDGYLLIRQLFDRTEIDLLRRAAKEDRELDQHAFGRQDGAGGKVRL
ncbi:MAG: phytanoyl-CoA dioxygenase family protein, partial [Planctomycetales bacterium]|nr:phytanoyl-CoA dioxygenase family protein [Planctomycetales bacterium]